MKLINVTVESSQSELVDMLSDNDRVNENVRFDPRVGKPLMKLKEKGGRLRMTCEFTGRATKDNGFLIGTFFWGRVREKDGKTSIKGIITTDPLFHLIILGLFCFFIVQCIINQGFSVVPIFVVLFDVMLYKDEFKKQGYIQRYIYRAVRRLSK